MANNNNEKPLPIWQRFSYDQETRHQQYTKDIYCAMVASGRWDPAPETLTLAKQEAARIIISFA